MLTPSASLAPTATLATSRKFAGFTNVSTLGNNLSPFSYGIEVAATSGFDADGATLVRASLDFLPARAASHVGYSFHGYWPETTREESR